MGEAEYRAIGLGVTELMWLKSLFQELGYPCVVIPIIWSDNLAAKSMSENPVFIPNTLRLMFILSERKWRVVKWWLDMFLLLIRWLMFLRKDCLGTSLSFYEQGLV